MPNHIDRILQNTRQYWYVDGIAELAMGSVGLLLGAYFGVQSWLPPDSALRSFMVCGFVAFVMLSTVLVRWLVNWLKQRITYPRTGYVAYPQPQRSRALINAVVALALGIIISALFAMAPESMAWIPAVSGLFFGVAWLYFAFRTGLGRFYALGMVSALAGVAISLSGLGEDPGLAIFYCVLGAATLVSGALTLINYLKKTQPAAYDEQEPSQ